MSGLYDYQWQQARIAFLTEHPLCVICSSQGRLTSATVVNHNPPHRDDPECFWDVSTWEPLCQPHHDSTQQRFEKSGIMPGCSADGTPIDQGHPWNEG